LSGGIVGIAAVRSLRDIKGRVKGIEISAVQMLLSISEDLSKSLEMHNFSHTEEADGITNLRILYHAQDIVIRAPGLLFGSEVFEKIRYGISL